jgi:hypothetical protein
LESNEIERRGMNRFRKLVPAAIAAVMILTVGLGNVWAQEATSKLPKCKGKYSAKWDRCFGEITYQDRGKRTYVGEFHNGLPHGEGKLIWDFIIHTGTFKYGEENGKGIRIFKLEGYESQHEGTWIDGRQRGKGKITTSDGDSYEGDFENNLKNGEGVEISKDKEKYIGQFKDDKRHGSGTIIFPSGYRFIGNFKGGQRNGIGSMYDATGKKIFFGQFRGGAANGFGFKLDISGKKIEEGIYQNGELLKNEAVSEERIKNTFVDVQVKDFIVNNPNKLPRCEIKSNGYPNLEKRCWNYHDRDGHLSMHEYENSERNGLGVFVFPSGHAFISEYKNGKREGRGIEIISDGKIEKEGIWQLDELVKLEQVDLPIFRKREYLEALGDFKESKFNVVKNKLAIQVEYTKPAADGSVTINVQTNADTASLLVNGEEQGGRTNGDYSIKKVARAGQETKFTITATDINGNKDTKVITVTRAVVDSAVKHAQLNPSQVKQQTSKDAVAIVIGIADYKNLPRADYANDDARVFYDYAIRALGVKPENIKLLVDADADEVGIYRAFKTWLPSRVRSTTDVYVYYSGHGLPTADGRGLYVLPQRADRDFIDKTAVTQAEINAAIQAAKPKSVTIFLDACYSGQARTGETLLVSARPVSLKAETRIFPDTFTVITASTADQISSSSPELKHGIFSYYLMRGMEGDADANKDGRITAGEMQAYLAENVSRQAGMMNRKQEPQLIGDASRVLVGK